MSDADREALATELQRIATRLAATIGRPVDIDDAQLGLLAHSAHDADVDAVRLRSILQRHPPPDVADHLRGLGIADLREPARIAARDDLGMAARVCVPVRSDGCVLGYVWLLDDDALDERAVAAATGAATAAADVLDRARLVRSDVRRREQELVAQVLSEPPDRAERALATLATEGLLTSAPPPLVLAVLMASPGSPGRGLALSAAVRRVTMPGEAASAMLDGQLGVLAVRATVAEGVATALVGLEADVSIGLASGADPAAAWRRARWAAGVAAAMPGRIAWWERLGARRYLIDADERVGAFAEREPTIAHVAGTAAGRDLLRTLDAYLDLAGDARAAAERLHLHRSSLYHRLARVQELLGLDLRDGIARLDVHLGLKAARWAGVLEHDDR